MGQKVNPMAGTRKRAPPEGQTQSARGGPVAANPTFNVPRLSRPRYALISLRNGLVSVRNVLIPLRNALISVRNKGISANMSSALPSIAID